MYLHCTRHCASPLNQTFTRLAPNDSLLGSINKDFPVGPVSFWRLVRYIDCRAFGGIIEPVLLRYAVAGTGLSVPSAAGAGREGVLRMVRRPCQWGECFSATRAQGDCRPGDLFV
jgi:hypothetical protein